MLCSAAAIVFTLEHLPAHNFVAESKTFVEDVMKRKDWLELLRAELLPVHDRRREVRWGRVVPLVVLSILIGLAAALGLRSAELIPLWAVTPVGNGLGFVLVWLWLPSALPLGRRLSIPLRLVVGAASAGLFVLFLVMATWSN